MRGLGAAAEVAAMKALPTSLLWALNYLNRGVSRVPTMRSHSPLRNRNKID